MSKHGGKEARIVGSCYLRIKVKVKMFLRDPKRTLIYNHITSHRLSDGQA